MTRKDYARLAAALKRSRPNSIGPQDGAPDQWQRDVRCIADELYSTNPRFDRERFYRAAGL